MSLRFLSVTAKLNLIKNKEIVMKNLIVNVISLVTAIVYMVKIWMTLKKLGQKPTRC
jgi:hypothetical protein